MSTEQTSAPVDNATQQGGNPVQGIEQQGEADFGKLINETKPAGNAGAPRRDIPTKDVSNEPDPGKVVTTPVIAAAAPATQQPSQADLIRDTVAATVQGLRQPQQQAAPKEVSPEEFDKKFRVVKVTDADITQLFDTDPKKAAAFLNGKIQGAVTQALLMAQELHESRIAEMRGEFEPHVKSWTAYQRQQHETAIEAKFFKDNPELADEKELVEEIKLSMIAKVNAGQVKFSSQDEANKAVADAAKKIVARMQKPAATPSNGTQTAVPGQQQNQGRQMSAASSAGRAGTGKAAAQSDVDLIFGAEAR